MSSSGSFFQIMWPPPNILTLQVRLHLRRENTLKKYEECHWGVIDKTTIVHFISNQFVARSHIFIKFIQIISVSGLILKSIKWMQRIGNQIRIKKRRGNFQGFVNSRLSRLQAETWANIINESRGVACQQVWRFFFNRLYSILSFRLPQLLIQRLYQSPI